MKLEAPYSEVRKTFVRAACLLRQSLGLENNGGVLFLDGTVGLRITPGGTLTRATSATIDNGTSRKSSDTSEKSTNRTLESTASKHMEEEMADILAFSTKEIPQGTCDKSTRSTSFKQLGEKVLHSLLKRYPRGKLWLFDDDRTLVSSSDEARGALQDPRNSRDVMELRREEAVVIQLHFPGGKIGTFIPKIN